jgi:hypothetical protein
VFVLRKERPSFSSTAARQRDPHKTCIDIILVESDDFIDFQYTQNYDSEIFITQPKVNGGLTCAALGSHL